VIPDEVANAVRDKQQADQAETAQLVAKERRSPGATPASMAA